MRPTSGAVYLKGEEVTEPPEGAVVVFQDYNKSLLPWRTVLANVAYGTHERQVLDFWRAESPRPTPLVFHIHGGGWVNGDKARVTALERYLGAGISVVSINYRFVTQAIDAGVKPPVQWPLDDAARALQFVRSKAAEWNLDKTRIAAAGGSAGACTSLWLAFHDDLADPLSPDPVARESTRVTCAAVEGAQTSLDPHQMRAWTPNITYGAHAFGITADASRKLSSFQVFHESRERILPCIREYSPYELVSRGDPPVGLYYSAPPNLGQPEKDPTHSANFGVKLKERCDADGVPCELVYPGATSVRHATMDEFVRAHLRPKSG